VAVISFYERMQTLEQGHPITALLIYSIILSIVQRVVVDVMYRLVPSQLQSEARTAQTVWTEGRSICLDYVQAWVPRNIPSSLEWFLNW